MRTTFQGPVRSLNGFYTQGPGNVVNIADGTNTITLTVADHAGRIIKTNDASLTITLPSINASAMDVTAGPGSDPNTLNNQGVEFFIFIETAATAVKIVTDGTDKYVGSILMVDTDTAGATTGYAPAASNDNINLNGTTTGGIAGSWVKVTALTTAKYLVEGVLLGSGTVATPFADA
jgi:hypothetical protein